MPLNKCGPLRTTIASALSIVLMGFLYSVPSTSLKKLFENIGVDIIYSAATDIYIIFFLFLIKPISITIITSMIGSTNVGSILCR